MVRNNEETSLVRIDNSIFGKMKRFWNNLFFRRNKNYDSYEVEENKYNEKETNSYAEQEVKKPRLFNFDAPENDMSVIPNGDDGEIASTENSDQYIDLFNTNNQAGVEKYFDEDEQYNNYEENKDTHGEEENEYDVKDEIQEKLMNYYASIKNSIKQ